MNARTKLTDKRNGSETLSMLTFPNCAKNRVKLSTKRAELSSERDRLGSGPVLVGTEIASTLAKVIKKIGNKI